MHPLCGDLVTLSQAWLNATPSAVSLLHPAKDFSQSMVKRLRQQNGTGHLSDANATNDIIMFILHFVNDFLEKSSYSFDFHENPLESSEFSLIFSFILLFPH